MNHFGEIVKIAIVTKKLTFISQSQVPSFIYLSLTITKLTGCTLARPVYQLVYTTYNNYFLKPNPFKQSLFELCYLSSDMLITFAGLKHRSYQFIVFLDVNSVDKMICIFSESNPGGIEFIRIYKSLNRQHGNGSTRKVLDHRHISLQ